MSSTPSPTLDFEKIKYYQERTFIPADADLTKAEVVTACMQKLLDTAISSAQAFEQWILDRSEFDAAVSQAGSILYIRMTCQTDDASCAESYTHFIQTVVPAIKPLDDALNKKFLELLKSFPLDEDRYGIYIKSVQTGVELFRQENIELETQINLLSQEYQTICGAMTVNFEGKEHTLPEMSKYLLQTDRDLRQRAWEATTQRRVQDRDKLEEIFNKMIKLRHQVAQNAGFENFRDYKFKALHRFDYTPEDCKQYHDIVEKTVLPLWKKIMDRRKEQMKLGELRPWDQAVDPLGRNPLKPFEKVEELVSGCERVFNKVDPELGAQFTGMAEEGLLDLASRKGKAPGGYQSALDESRRPFIFMNAVGVDGDVRTLLHEGGHAFHSLASAEDPIVDYRHGPMEFNEVASMAMELLGNEYLEEFYSAEDAHRSKEEHLEDVVFTLAWVATIDCYQHWMYENPEHSEAEREAKWLEIYNRFGGKATDWSGYEEAKACLWHRQLHIFEVPFYYIEYGIAQLGALQVWQNAKKDQKKATADYRHGLSYGGAKPLPFLYEAAGIRFNFAEETIAPLMKAIEKELF